MVDFLHIGPDGDLADSLADPDGTGRLKAAGRSIPVAGSGDDSATHLVEDATLLTGTGGQVVAAGPVATALRGVSTLCVRVTVKALLDNGDPLYVGIPTVTADADNDTGGFPLQPGEGITFGASDLADVYILGTVGEGCSFLYET